jgi:hypothetical protein
VRGAGHGSDAAEHYLYALGDYAEVDYREALDR